MPGQLGRMLGDDTPDFEQARDEMVDRLVDHGRVSNRRVIDALRAVPRHEFVPQSHRSRAYEDRPLPIGDGQTISAPHMVGIMAELLDLQPGMDVLEIGTGCGYHAAVIAEIVGNKSVYSIEYSQELAETTRQRLAELGYDISIKVGDGHNGWPAHAPYDRIYLTCAAVSLPDSLVEQATTDGILLAPIGRRQQTLYRYRKRADGSLDRDSHGGVRFVQMRGPDET